MPSTACTVPREVSNLTWRSRTSSSGARARPGVRSVSVTTLDSAVLGRLLAPPAGRLYLIACRAANGGKIVAAATFGQAQRTKFRHPKVWECAVHGVSGER